MIRILSLRIREFRGIRDATFAMGGKNFVLVGPNGSGKSGVVDAIQFVLTGEIRRLTGSGTGELSLAGHGPHVTQRHRPEQSIVEAKVHFPSLKKDAEISRCIAAPGKPTIVPDDPEVRAAFAELERHPEITLSRREVIRLILTPATQRSQMVQTLLHQDEIERTRKALRTTETRLEGTLREARAAAKLRKEALARHLGLEALSSTAVLESINRARNVLGLAPCTEWTRSTVFTEGLDGSGADRPPGPGRASAIADLDEIDRLLGRVSRGPGAAVFADLQAQLEALRAVPGGVAALRGAELTQAGIDLLTGGLCPLCDTQWEEAALREHLAIKLARGAELRKLQRSIAGLGTAVAEEASRLMSVLESVIRLPESAPEVHDIAHWVAELRQFAQEAKTIHDVLVFEGRPPAPWSGTPDTAEAGLREVRVRIQQRPGTDAAATARDVLTGAQLRFGDLVAAKEIERSAEESAQRGRLAYKVYCEVSAGALRKLYRSLEADFVRYYRFLNRDDEGQFSAQLSPAESKLGLTVDFHRVGMFPPGALHSEGHQDGMGLCLHLALLKEVLGTEFTLAVLDDVVMSVDADHRRRVCQLLREEFPSAQFVITTHDQVWANQMRSQGLVERGGFVSLHGWSVEGGPAIAEGQEVWDRIDEDLGRADVPAAAARLRRFVEEAARDLAHNLAARVAYRADAAYDVGDLLAAVVGAYGKSLKAASKAAQSWGRQDEMKRIEEAKIRHAAAQAAMNIEKWAVNAVVHFNEWASLTVSEFRDVIQAFRGVFDQMRCDEAACGSWVFTVPRVAPVDLRCACGRTRFNLQEKRV